MNAEQLLSLTVAEIMKRWPQSVPIFIAHRLDCVGCPMTSFETLAEIIEIYNVPKEKFLQELETVIQQSAPA